MRTTITGAPLKKQDACKDNAGFVARKCPACCKQKPLTPEMALVYGLPVGAKVKLPSVMPNAEQRQRAERRG